MMTMVEGRCARCKTPRYDASGVYLGTFTDPRELRLMDTWASRRAPVLLSGFGMGDIFGDAVSWFGDALSNAARDPVGTLQNIAAGIASANVDDIVDAVQKLPGGDVVSPSLRAFVDGPMRDFAKSDIGKFLLEANATANYALLVPFLGPQLAAVAFSEPSFLAGDDFSKAWANETINRIQQTAKVLSAGELDTSGLDVDTSWAQLPPDLQQKLADLTDLITSQISKATDFLHGLGLDALSQMTYDELARQLQIREDAAVAALVNVRNNAAELAAYKLLKFDPATGALIVPTGQKTFANQLTAREAQTEKARMDSTTVQRNLVMLAHPSTATTSDASSGTRLMVPGASSPVEPPSAVHPAVHPLPIHQQIVASAPTHEGLSTAAKGGLALAGLTVLGVGLKVAGIL